MYGSSVTRLRRGCKKIRVKRFSSTIFAYFSAGFRLAEARMCGSYSILFVVWRPDHNTAVKCDCDAIVTYWYILWPQSALRGWAEGLLKPHNHTVSVLQTCLSWSRQGHCGIDGLFWLGIRHDIIVIYSHMIQTSFKDFRHDPGPPVRSLILASSLDTMGLLPSGHTKMHEADQKMMMKRDPEMAD